MMGCKERALKSAKILSVIALSLLMLSSLVLSKLSLVWLLGGTTINNVNLNTWYAAFGLILIVPETFALLKVVWHTSFIKRTKTHQWPGGLALCVGFLVSFAEVCSYMVFTLEVAPRLPIHILLPLLGAVHAVSLCHEQWEYWRTETKVPVVDYDGNFSLAHTHDCHEEENAHVHEDLHGPSQRRSWKRIVIGILGFSGIWTSCAIAGIVVLTSPLPWFQALCLPTCLGILSLCWHPKVQVYIVRSHDGTYAGRWKATCVYTVLKLLTLLVGLSIVMAVRLREHDVLDTQFFRILWEGLYACRNPEILYPLIVHFGSSLCVHVFGFLSTTLCLAGLGLTIPTLLATPISVAVALYFCTAGYTFLDNITCSADGIGIWCACGLAFVTWVAPLILRGTEVNKSGAILLKPFEELFIQQTWNSIFLEHHLSLNYKYDGFSSTEHIMGSGTSNSPCKIFICTTMYREANFEMGRLLKSLYKVSQSEKLKDINFEAHIFLDNGTQDLHLTEFASQLVSLLQTKMQIAAEDAGAYKTPYGVQLHWNLVGGMPFFIHLKDSGKVKPKKRWSQIMYMSYVLNFRVLHDHQIHSDLNHPDGMEHIDDSLFVGYASDKEWNKNNVTLTRSKSKADHAPPFNEQNRRNLANMFSCDQSELAEGAPGVASCSPTAESSTSTSIASLMNTFGKKQQRLLQQQISSDQGIGGSDDASSSSLSLPRELESSDTAGSRCSSLRRANEGEDEDCSDLYEGDISSNNGNSLTTGKVRRMSLRVRDAHKDHTIFEQGVHHRETSPRRPVPPPRHKHHRKRDQRHNSQKIQLLSRTDSGSCCTPSQGVHNPVFQSDSGETSNAGCSMPNEKDTNVFVISPRVQSQGEIELRKPLQLDENTYILATDADMEFGEDSVLHLLTLCKNDRRIGGACGRTHPVGQRTGPIVWYQMFEYAKDFWMIKSAQNVIGSVMCCPGCFSLYRAGAVRDVLGNYAAPIQQPFDVFVKDSGEDRWMCTLMMLHGWKLEYTAFCDNTTYCPDSLLEFMKQRRRWVLSDMANMLLVFRHIFRLAQNNDSFSIAYILYMMQMFIIVLLSPASTIVILAGGLDIVYGVPFEFIAPFAGVIVLAYALICIVGGPKLQVRLTLALTLLTGMAMLLVVIGGSVYVFQDMAVHITRGTLTFEEYQLILLLIAALAFAAIIHPKETWVLAHGVSYLLGFPAMQILLPIYAVCNIVDQSWGTRDQNESKSPPVSCFSRQRKKYHKSLSKKSKIPDCESSDVGVGVEDEHPVECTSNFIPMDTGHQAEEYLFWQRMHDLVLGNQVNLGVDKESLASGLRVLRNGCLLALLVLNSLWLTLLSVLYFNADVNVVRLNVYGLIAGIVYGLVLFIQFVGMSIHRVQAVLTRLGLGLFSKDKPVWVYARTAR